MRNGMIVVYVKSGLEEQLIDEFNFLSCEGWDDQIKIIPFKIDLQSTEIIEQQLTEDIQKYDISKILVDKNLRVNCSKFKGERIKVRSCSQKTIRREICEELINRRLHWLPYSINEWNKSGIRYFHPQRWCDQFSSLGYTWIGQGLLKQIRVISDAELRYDVLVSATEQIGLRVAHGYISDREPGSSSINIKDILEHLYNMPIIEIDLNTAPPLLINELNILYIYEDGLWSGVELVKRLALLAEWQPVRSQKLKVIFRYGATSDAGLLAGRNFIQREGLTSSIEILPAKSNHFTMLKEDVLNDTLRQIGLVMDEEFRHSLDNCVLPYAFRVSNIWKGKINEATDICRDIGLQLVRPWLQRTKKDDGVLENKVAKWSLGAFGFASMITFSMSIPKPVLPLLWLSGDVNMGGKNIKWKPLFWDARRIGSSPPTIE